LKLFNITILALFAGLMIAASFGLPGRGELQAPVNQEVSPAGTRNAAAYYIEHAYHDTHSPNMVTAVLADYRGYDTLGEETVILTAGLICFLLLRQRRNHKGDKSA
jgi:multicomponent Na+:H+ antiporter subunit B